MHIYVLYIRRHSRESGKVLEPNLTNYMWFFKHYFTALRLLCMTRKVYTALHHTPGCWERIRKSKPIVTENGSKFMGTWICTSDKNFDEFVILKCPLMDHVVSIK